MAMDLDSILKTGVLLAFLLPALAIVGTTLPAPTSPYVSQAEATNITTAMNGTAQFIDVNFLHTVGGLNKTLTNPTNGSYYANPTIFQAFAFILSGFGTVMTDIVMLPYLDFVALNYIATGFSLILPPSALSFIMGGTDLLYSYMLVSMLLLGVSAIQKYNMRSG